MIGGQSGVWRDTHARVAVGMQPLKCFISIPSMQDMFTISHGAHYFFLITYGLWAVVLDYVVNARTSVSRG